MGTTRVQDSEVLGESQEAWTRSILSKCGFLDPSCLHSNKEKEEGTVRVEEKEAEGNWGLKQEEKEGPLDHERVASSSE